MFGDLIRLAGFSPRNWELTDLSDLKDKGEYTEETEEKGDLIIKRTHFRSNDGSTVIHREITTNKKAEEFAKLYDLRRKINKLLREDKFEEAIPLRDQYRELAQSLKPALPESKTKRNQ